MTEQTALPPSKSIVLQDLDLSYLPPEINQCYQSFPFTPPNVIAAPIQEMIESFLPGMERAIALCDNFLEQLSWMFHIVSRQLCVNELIPMIYKQNAKPYGPHDLALLLIVLGIGCLVDLDLPPFNLEAQHYYRLARATLALQPVLAEQSVVTIKVSSRLTSIVCRFLSSRTTGIALNEHLQWNEWKGEQPRGIICVSRLSRPSCVTSGFYSLFSIRWSHNHFGTTRSGFVRPSSHHVLLYH